MADLTPERACELLLRPAPTIIDLLHVLGIVSAMLRELDDDYVILIQTPMSRYRPDDLVKHLRTKDTTL